MNLQENYKQLFKGKARSNDTSILREAKYNIKVTKHDVRSKEKGAKGFAVTYEGTISGPGIPNGTEWYGGGIAGDVIDAEKIPGWNPDGKDGYWSDGLTITFIMDLQPTGNVYVYHPNNTNYKNKDERQDWETESKRTHVFTKEVKDELAPLFDDAVVKYALSKGLEDHVAEKSGGTFNMEVATNAIAKKKKPKRKVVKPELVRVDDGEVDGMDRTASGTYGSKKWELETDDGMTAIYLNGKSIEETDPELYDAILTTVNDEGYELEEQRTYKKGMAMNLQENYKRLFKGRPAGNDGSILFESRYNIKVTKHEVNSDKNKGAKAFAVTYWGTISGPDIPNGTTWYAPGGVAGDVIDAEKIPGWNPDGKGNTYWDTLTMTFIMRFPDTKTSTNRKAVYLYHANDTGRRHGDPGKELERSMSQNPNDNWDAHMKMTKEKKDEVSKMLDDAVVKYALSKGLEDHVAEKSGGTFNMEVATNAIAKKKKPKRKKLGNIVVADGEVDGRNRKVSGYIGKEGNKEWELTTDDGQSYIFVDGESLDDEDPMYDAILTAADDEGYEIDLDEGITMNLQENYKRLFKGKASSNDRKLIRENMNDFKFSYPSPAFESKAEEVLKAMENDMLENFDSYDDWVEYGSDSPSREVEDLTDDLVALDPKKGYTVDDWMEEVAFPYIKKNHG